MGTIPGSPLGKAAHYVEQYDSGLLYPVERAPQREALGIGAALPFAGEDTWTAWEVSWLDADGRPRIAIATFDVPCESPRIVESKSVKLYLASLNGTRLGAPADVLATLASDLSSAVGAPVRLALAMPHEWSRFARRPLDGEPIDDALVGPAPDAPDRATLRAGGASVDETLLFRAFRSVCPVTGQPDFAQLQLRYRGPAIDRAALAAYLVGFRHHPGFHEHCVERIYVDVAAACAPEALAVAARFTRRGGIDINPRRTSPSLALPPAGPTEQQ